MILDLFGKTSLCQVVVRKKSKPRQARRRKSVYDLFIMISPQELDAARACAGGSPTAQIEHAHIFDPTGGSGQTSQETVVFRFPTPKGPGKHYIKNPELTTPPMV